MNVKSSDGAGTQTLSEDQVQTILRNIGVIRVMLDPIPHGLANDIEEHLDGIEELVEPHDDAHES